MGIGISVLLLAAGAILFWAVGATMDGINLDAVGIILMIAGGVGLLWSLVSTSAAERRRVMEE